MPPATAEVERRTRAPHGANRAVLLAAVRERPGASAGELAAAAGIARPVIYALLNRLTAHGELVGSELPGGSSGYALRPEPPAPGLVPRRRGHDRRRRAALGR
ncbi:helix-turn-helix domain-containing protein [Candidatus Solirubrobacter pratensis]|uniref:helix-turn-helix domain-containing protein n=1 Tax=Candidatus Solirubrobacter pratensis TaxID=1298857 RepID=UPI000480B8A4|nr:helix-turn-helix domain-containing protein [Candidatus Solirubrobacter pratensis]